MTTRFKILHVMSHSYADWTIGELAVVLTERGRTLAKVMREP